jgi:hypothetical protein
MHCKTQPTITSSDIMKKAHKKKELGYFTHNLVLEAK